jgi:potassium-transporting ATPase KdpC subunit
VRGSELLAQGFTQPKYFWPRPSATAKPYDASASAASHLGAHNPALREAVAARVKALKDADPSNAKPIPVDLVTASASGLDPHISPEAAEYQLSRVAKARGMKPEDIRKLVKEHTEALQYGLLGMARVNVLKLNMALDTK